MRCMGSGFRLELRGICFFCKITQRTRHCSVGFFPW
jgi:hypothetical protein